MSSKAYVTEATLEINGQKISDFKGVSEKPRRLRKQVKLMGGKLGHGRLTAEYGVTLDYVVPAAPAVFDFAAVEDGTLTLVYEGGRRVIYTGVSTLEIGEAKTDGENELVQTIDFGATGRREE
jgi:hypothetical protein